MATQPAKQGDDFVVYSLTNYIGGHGDAIDGAVLGLEGNLTEIRRKIGIRMAGRSVRSL